MFDIDWNVYTLFDKVDSYIFKIKKMTRGSIHGFTQEQLSDLARVCEVIPYIGAITTFDYESLCKFKGGIGDYLKMLFSYGIGSCIFYTFVEGVPDEQIQLMAKNYTYKLLSYEEKVLTIKFMYEELNNREFDIASYYECLGDLCIFHDPHKANYHYNKALDYYNRVSLDSNGMLVAGNKQDDHYSCILQHAWSLYYDEEVPFYTTYHFEGANRMKDKISRLSTHH
ncbi:hypothetical protein HZI73_15635 [Vallitalea pronyensis]|uniref:Uncharacterized protein n=1 Tax=Vallitalea pronyensis TaxID=1348613 RepID=A0A8J8MLJ9_9FIRM|nr:hypothetical protein [Vallitalea pronyensis]QUI23632.1 hypothetical protein HZI73_15635 [Vallitalea pronyensis]